MLIKPLVAIIAIFVLAGCVASNQATIDNGDSKIVKIFQESDYETAEVAINNQNVTLAIADDAEKQAQGLSDKTQVPYDGMLFIIEPATMPAFWMKDMQINIDIIWVSQGKVVDLDADVSPEPGTPDDKLRLYRPNEKVDLVIELPAGQVAEMGIKAGSEIEIN